MKISSFRYLGITIGGALAIVAGIYIFNTWLFSYVPQVSSLILPDEALFFEGLLILILGVLILLRLPHARMVGGRRQILMGSGGLINDTESRKNRTKNVRVVGFALVTASIMLFLLYFLGIQ